MLVVVVPAVVGVVAWLLAVERRRRDLARVSPIDRLDRDDAGPAGHAITAGDGVPETGA